MRKPKFYEWLAVVLPRLVSDIACDVRDIRDIVRQIAVDDKFKTVVVVWCVKRVGESAWRTECQWKKIALGTTERFELSSGPWFGGGRIESGSMITILGGFAQRVVAGHEIVGGGNSMTLMGFLEPETVVIAEVQAL